MEASFTGGSSVSLLGFSVAQFQDSLTMNHPLLAGRGGRLKITVDIDGETLRTGTFGAGHAFMMGANNASGGGAFTSSTYGRFDIPLLFDFVYGVPVDFFAQLSAGVGHFTFNRTGFYPLPPGAPIINISQYSTGNPGSGYARYGNTLVLSGLTAYDEFGNVVEDVTYASASGTVYTRDGVLTPEPASAVLLPAALAALAGLRTLKRRRNR